MYDKILFPVSFYLLDHNELADHLVGITSGFDASVHVLSLTLSDEGRQDVEDHRNAFNSFETRLKGEDTEFTSELRDEPVEYADVADVIADEAEAYDAVLVGHTKVREGTERTTAESLINRLSIPVFVVPMSTPRFRDV
ncbi:MAG: nucleotide-binding universal stress UspA family protein [Methanobacteriota archaeon]|jgi:nucleotide-binding universal stress UspA family protein|uniref:Universal stress protein n=1 Tax=Halorutilus salinus TaxID=2487751 RepID=A0A9Q4C2C3_9EURY|nr:universal stress protein [Halorutilus salinus]MCX2818023.1 universal stress protein [Halorutilus salinus]